MPSIDVSRCRLGTRSGVTGLESPPGRGAVDAAGERPGCRWLDPRLTRRGPMRLEREAPEPIRRVAGQLSNRNPAERLTTGGQLWRVLKSLLVIWHVELTAAVEPLLLPKDAGSHRLSSAGLQRGGPPRFARLLRNPERDPDYLPLVLRPVRIGAQHALGMRVRAPGPLEVRQRARLD